MTVGFWIFFGILSVAAIISIVACSRSCEDHTTILVAIVCCAVLALTFGIGKWYYSSTASGQRALKDQESELSNGIERTVKIIADDGYTLYEYHGKMDIEMHDEYIVFDESGIRHIIYKSKTATLIIEEAKP